METKTVLDGYLRKAVNPNNDDLDVSAIDQFCLTLKKDPSKMSTARELLVNRIQSTNPKESLLALEALEECMESLGREFRSEINKFRFLNELIKMVSKKYNGEQTPPEVSERILNIMLTWTNKYDPCECDKIQEAYSLLATQGIQHRSQQNVIIRNSATAAPRPSSDDRNQTSDKHQQKLRQLISSGKREDFEKANLLIQNFCRDEERRTQMKSRRLSELQKVAENTKLLDEMLDQYGRTAGETSDDDAAVLNEIYESCESAHPTIVRLAEETQHCEEMLGKIFEVNDALTQVLDKYRQKVLNQPPAGVANGDTVAFRYTPNIVGPDPLDTLFDVSEDGTAGISGAGGSKPTADRTNYDDILSDIFTASSGDSAVTALGHTSQSILMPHSLAAAHLGPSSIKSDGTANSKDHLMEINTLLSSISAGTMASGKIVPGKPVPSETAAKGAVPGAHNSSNSVKNGGSGGSGASLGPKSIPELDSIITGMKATLLSTPAATATVVKNAQEETESTSEPNVTGSATTEEDDPILAPPNPLTSVPATPDGGKPLEIKALADIVIDLDSIQPSKEPSRTVLDDKEGLQITLNFGADHPRPDVTVIVISTINQGRIAIPSFQFDASVRKPCKLRLLPPSATSLPGTKPFRPPADGITQVLLLANPTAEPVDLTCILTYLVGDDPDPIKESIVMKAVPSLRD
ncbi:ADP-ribosylation factor-binding protein GGA1 [Anopheles cruzii]|uniref:ADP-ribosylation factor-binding protein GGA1 n=1 Tax=Anopheles cruzii TaxID=68878 RepID=UPI0022EC7132|nr:ADP-ribosylation factor-binding protein GGA1 [Anopheles cruzii]